MTILVTGSCGYIGSHVSQCLNYNRIKNCGLDNLHTGLPKNRLTKTYIVDIRNMEEIDKVFEDIIKEEPIDCVIHLAALTSVPESMESIQKKQEYEDVNTTGTENLLKVMKKYDCTKLIFSSTASVYKESNKPIKETDPIEIKNNYALTKRFAEDIIKQQDWLDYIIFRYFNVIGHSGTYCMDNELKKTNIVPTLTNSIMTNMPFKIYGNNYPIKRENPEDHTCVRDYIDVRDIARAHICGIDYMHAHKRTKQIFNLGTQKGSSVLELINTFEKVNNVHINKHFSNRRKGDPASLIANSTKARQLLRWEPMYSLKESLKIDQ